MRLPLGATHLHMRASSYLTRRLKRRHQSRGRRGTGQPAGAQRALAGSRTPLGAFGRFLHAAWQHLCPRPGGDAPPIPVAPPASRVLAIISFHAAEADLPLEGVRPYTLRAHAQARWRRAAGWA